jgi:hypothetical protein
VAEDTDSEVSGPRAPSCSCSCHVLVHDPRCAVHDEPSSTRASRTFVYEHVSRSRTSFGIVSRGCMPPCELSSSCRRSVASALRRDGSWRARTKRACCAEMRNDSDRLQTCDQSRDEHVHVTRARARARDDQVPVTRTKRPAPIAGCWFAVACSPFPRRTCESRNLGPDHSAMGNPRGTILGGGA